MKNLMVLLIAVGVGAAGWSVASTATSPVQFPSPPSESRLAHQGQTAVIAGGCFWGMEGVFEHVRGVRSVTAGYAGGTRATASYDQVSSERTGHAEAVRITYDPAVISYGQLLEIYFAVAHDPTQVDGQYPDTGHSYRSAIFPQSEQQRQVARNYIAELGKARVFPRPIATRIEAGEFFPAEGYHQQFMRRHPDHPYIQRWDVAKVQHLKAKFPQWFMS